MTHRKLQAVVLAAGKSSRFNTDTPKQLTPLCGQAMLLYPLKTLAKLHIATIAVLGHKAETISAAVKEAGLTIDVAIQREQKGTAHAVLCSQEYWDAHDLLILNGDTPLISVKIIQDLIDQHVSSDAAISFLAAQAFDPSGYGRVIADHEVCKIVEEKDCTQEEREQTRINAGVYLVKRDFLQAQLSHVKASDVTGEVYLPDLVAIAHEKGLKVNVIDVPYDSVRGVNTLKELWEVEQIKRCELLRHWKSQGVRFMMPTTVHIETDVSIGKNTVIGTGAYLVNGTSIGQNCTIEPFVVLSNATIGDNCRVLSHSALYDSTLKNNVEVGPFARLRDNVTLEKDVVVGNFVEIKKSSLGAGSKAKHLSYLGDASVGTRVNVGAGTITCNHDGQKKHPTTIEDEAYVGSNTTLVAPVTVGKQAFTAAGSVITKNVDADDLAIGRSRQVNKKGYATLLKQKRAGKQATIKPAMSDKGSL